MYETDFAAYPLYQDRSGIFWFQLIAQYVSWELQQFPDSTYNGKTYGTNVMPGVHLCPFQKGLQDHGLTGPTKIALPLTSYGYNRSGIGFWAGGKAYRLGLGVGGTDPQHLR